MSSIPARMKKIQFKMKALECSQDFSHYKSMEVSPDAQGQLTRQSMVGSGQILNLSDFMVVLVTCKTEDDPIKNAGPIVFTRFLPLYYMGIFPQSLVRSGQISN